MTHLLAATGETAGEGKEREDDGGKMEETINRSSTQSERREEAKQVEQQRREEDGQSSEKTARQEGDTSEVGDGSEMAPETLQHRWTSIKLPPPSPFCLIILLSRRGEQRHAASLLYQQRPHSRRTKMNRWRGSQPTRRWAGANVAAGDE